MSYQCARRQGAFKDKLSLFFFKIVSHFVFILANVTFHLLLNIVEFHIKAKIGKKNVSKIYI